jgi:hypothetical protein
MLTSLLDLLTDLYEDKNIPIIKKLLPGKDKAEIEKVLSEISSHHKDLIDIYSWRNGIILSTDVAIAEQELIPEAIFLSLESAYEFYAQYTNQGVFEKYFFPLFTDGGGGLLLLDVGKQSKTYGSLLLFSPSLLLSQIPVTIYDSLECFFKSTLDCFSTGAYNFDRENGFTVDYDLKYEISEGENPNSEYWRL